MVVETGSDKQLWQLLWAHAAHQVVLALPAVSGCETLAAGYGWGLRRCADRRHAVLVHPSGEDSAVGDLSLTVLGFGTQVIPRCGRSYPDYLAEVADVVETTIGTYLLN